VSRPARSGPPVAADAGDDRGARPLLPLALAAGILAVSTGSLFVRFAQRDAASLTVAAARLGLATLALAPFALIRHRASLAALTRGDLAFALLAGAFLALHFATWIVSLEHTTVASSVVLVTTSPLWVALLAPWLLGERLTPRIAAGIGLALAGAALVGLADAGGAAAGPGTGDARAGTLRGDLLALCGAWMMAGYLLMGRRLRARLPLVPYVFLVYGMAAVLLTLAALATGAGFSGLPAATWGWLALLALVPQLIGHTTYNWALRDVPAALVAVTMVGEPVGSAVLALLFLGERPGTLTLVGGAVILAGIVIAVTRGRPRPRALS
jgi:drug/metabolite transporter (DMT)-like permease